MPLKINSPFLTRFAFRPSKMGRPVQRVLCSVNSSWRYVFDDDECRPRVWYGSVVGTRRERSLPLLCVHIDGCDRLNWIGVPQLRHFQTEGKSWRFSEFATTIQGARTTYKVRAEGSALVIPTPTTDNLRRATSWRDDQLANRIILSEEEARNFTLPTQQ